MRRSGRAWTPQWTWNFVGTDYGTELKQAVAFCWDARFNCVGTNLVFSQWIADAHHTLPPAGITLSYSSYPTFNGQGYENLQFAKRQLRLPRLFLISAASAIPGPCSNGSLVGGLKIRKWVG